MLKRIHARLNLGYMQKWLLVAGSIGVVAGLGAIVFFESIKWATHLFLGCGAGYFPPGPVGEGEPVVRAIAHRWMIPVITTVGGLLSGLIVYTLAPEAEGHGTDAAIGAFHHRAGLIRARVPLVKIIASAITIGSGGSAGREGPTAQIAAGFGSIMAQALKLNVMDRRIAVAAGIGAGIGAIFKAPLGGALLSAEILYLQGFEVEALIPSCLASVVGYAIFAGYTGYMPIFGQMSQSAVPSLDPVTLVYYAVLGGLCGLVGILYPKTFYATRDAFKKLKMPNWLKPGLGGLLVGILGYFLPQVLGMGYGWLELGMLNASIPLTLVIVLVFAKIVATSLSIGSGGSGGVFAPGLFIGGFMGLACWQALHGMPHLPSSPEPFIVVGMMALFGAVARAPLAVMFMVGEMTGGFGLLIPAMIAIGPAYILVGHNTIYESQVPTTADSPAHSLDFYFPLLKGKRVVDVMNRELPAVESGMPLREAHKVFLQKRLRSLPVVNEGDGRLLAGVITREDFNRIPEDGWEGMTAGRAMSEEKPIVIGPEEPLDEALMLMSDHGVGLLLVVAGRRLLGSVSRRAVLDSFLRAVRRRGAEEEEEEGQRAG